MPVPFLPCLACFTSSPGRSVGQNSQRTGAMASSDAAMKTGPRADADWSRLVQDRSKDWSVGARNRSLARKNARC